MCYNFKFAKRDLNLLSNIFFYFFITYYCIFYNVKDPYGGRKKITNMEIEGVIRR